MAVATEMLSGFRSTGQIRKASITRFDYIVYHLENHLIRSISVLDRSQLLTNAVFQLGLDQKKCRFQYIVNNDCVAKTSVATTLKELNKLLGPLRKLRNEVIHGRQLSDKDLQDIEAYYVLQKDDMQQDIKDSVASRYSHSYNSKTNTIVKNKKRLLSKINHKIFSSTNQFLDALQPHFLNRYEAMARLPSAANRKGVS